MNRLRLDVMLAERGLVASRSQGESYVRLGRVWVNGKLAVKSGQLVRETDIIEIKSETQYVGRAAFKLESADRTFMIDWRDKTVLDVGSSTGGFTQYALLHGAAKVVAIDVGTNQMHPSLRDDPRIELHEKLDVRDLILGGKESATLPTIQHLAYIPDIVVMDVSFISLREILPHITTLIGYDTEVLAMVKPQFEAGHAQLKHKGVIKNDRLRRVILKDFEQWVQHYFKIIHKVDSEVAGSKGNVERFYMLRKLP
jgi:23S rRNA (cytidine1920-2'-O)/16S rRNA (cytidine1409-2'-O)-methyltransferase